MSPTGVEDRYKQVDKALQEYLERFVAADDAWLLLQTLLTGRRRRSQLAKVSADIGARWLDVGAGFGALAFDVACGTPCEVVAVDQNPDMLAAGRWIRDTLRERGVLQGDVSFVQADVASMPFPTDSFSVVAARFLFQHLNRPYEAAREIARVLRPDGFAYCVDVDDQFALSYPPSAAYDRLNAAFNALQEARGGDRFVGRKLAHYLASQGLLVREANVDMTAAATPDLPSDLARAYALLRLDQARADMDARGILDDAAFGSLRDDFANERTPLRFQCNAEVVVVAQKPRA